MLRYVAFIVVLSLSPALWAEAPTSVANTQAVEAPAARGEPDHAALRQLMKEATASLNELDSTRLSQFLADDFVLTFADQTVITELGQFEEYLDTYFREAAAPLKSLHLVPEATETTQFIDQRTGVVYGTSADTYTLADDSRLVLNTHWTATVIEDDGTWRIRAFHAGVNMLDNPILDATRQTGYLWGGLGLIIGFLIGALLMRLRGR